MTRKSVKRTVVAHPSQRARRWASTQGCLLYTSETPMADRWNRLTSSSNVATSKCPLDGRFAPSPRRLNCANTSHYPRAPRMGQMDPEVPFVIGPMNGREARESGLRPKAEAMA